MFKRDMSCTPNSTLNLWLKLQQYVPFANNTH